MRAAIQPLKGIEDEIDLWAKGRLQPRSDRAAMTLPKERLASVAGPLPQMANDGSRGLNNAVPHYKNGWGTEWGTADSQKKKKPLKSATYSIFVAEGEGFEPSKPFDLHTFQACSFDHSDTPPHCGPHALGLCLARQNGAKSNGLSARLQAGFWF